MSSKGPAAPVYWKNSFFWFAAVLLGLGVWGMISGEQVIRDPGQVKESNLALYYLAGALIMAVNGVITHRLGLKAFRDEQEAAAS